MSISTAATISSPSSERLSASELLELARSWVPRLGNKAGSGQPDQRWYCRLEWNETYEVWLLGWSGVQATEVHDHGGSSGAVVVAAGAVVEHRFDPARGTMSDRTLEPGDSLMFDQDVIHDVQNAGGPSSLTIHVYSPPLDRQTYYDVSGGIVTPRKTVEVEAPEPDFIDVSAEFAALTEG